MWISTGNSFLTVWGRVDFLVVLFRFFSFSFFYRHTEDISKKKHSSSNITNQKKTANVDSFLISERLILLSAVKLRYSKNVP